METTIKARIDPDVKRLARKRLSAKGLTMSDAINLLFGAIAGKDSPEETRNRINRIKEILGDQTVEAEEVISEETLKSLEEMESGVVETFKSLEAFQEFVKNVKIANAGD